ncbi:methyltransferase domain-containing protein [Candidatus Sumerlaeota bacterium]|nr:methyltransferase domain-containing protein [Candidatus Sumerlaeota bacterium]
MKRQTPHQNWQNDYFGDAYLELYASYLYDPKEVQSETEFVIEALNLNKGDALLDLACGFGKHLHFFLKKGMKAFGLDISLKYLQSARNLIPKIHLRKLSLVRGDMRTLPFGKESFDAVCCLFNSFGYFPPGNPDPYMGILREIRRILKPGGRFFLEVPNKKPVLSMVRNSPQTLQCGNGFLIHELWDYDEDQCTLHNKTTFTIEDRQTRVGYQLYLFSRGELASLFKKTGFRVIQTFGDYEDSPYSLTGSPYLLIVGEKTGTNPD